MSARTPVCSAYRLLCSKNSLPGSQVPRLCCGVVALAYGCRLVRGDDQLLAIRAKGQVGNPDAIVGEHIQLLSGDCIPENGVPVGAGRRQFLPVRAEGYSLNARITAANIAFAVSGQSQHLFSSACIPNPGCIIFAGSRQSSSVRAKCNSLYSCCVARKCEQFSPALGIEYLGRAVIAGGSYTRPV